MRPRLLLALALSAAVQFPCGASAQGTASTALLLVEGSVVDSASGEALVGVNVSLTSDSQPGPASKVVTDQSGRFRIQLPTGIYTVWATKSGYSPSSPGQADYSGSGVPVVLDMSKRLHHISIRLWRLPRAVGRIEDAKGHRLAGVDVLARRVTAVSGQFRFVGSQQTKSDDNGDFSFENLPTGRYLFSIAAREADAAGTPATAYYPGVVSSADAELIKLAPGASRSDLVFVRPEVSLRIVAGTVQGADEALRRGMDAVLVQTNIAKELSDVVVAATRVETNGKFIFRGIPDGAYSLRVLMFPTWPDPKVGEVRGNRIFEITTAPNLGMPPSEKKIERLPDGATVWGQTSIDVDGKNLTDVVVDGFRGFVVRGRVFFDGGVPPADEVLPTNYISVRPADGRSLGFYPAGRIEPDGTFETVGLPRGKYLIGMPFPFPGWSVQSVVIGGIDAAGRSFELSGDVSDAVVTLTQRPASLAGIVRDGNGRATASTVVIFSEDTRDWGDFSNWLSARSARILTKGDGTFSAQVFPGRYLLVAMPPGPDATAEWQTKSFLEAIARFAIRVEVRKGELVSREMHLSLIRR